VGNFQQNVKQLSEIEADDMRNLTLKFPIVERKQKILLDFIERPYF